MPIRFDPVTLNTLGGYDYNERIKGPVSIAHPRLDHASGRHYTYSLEFGRRSKYHLIGIDQAAGQEAVVATLRAERPAYIHSFGMSEWYLVLAEFRSWSTPFGSSSAASRSFAITNGSRTAGVQFHVVEKESGQVVRNSAEPGGRSLPSITLTLRRGRRGVVDIVAFPDSGVINQVYLDPLRSAEPVTATESSPSSGSARVRTFLMRGCRRPGSNFPALTPVPRRTPAPLRLWGWERGAGKLHRQSREVGPRA
jgi:beta,beta-carotene 9',10'-dioxygenase